MTPKITTEIFVQRAREKHGDKYDYSKVEYKDANTKVCIICPIHGAFWQIARSHLKGRGCPICANWGIWNKETCHQEAKKYNTRQEFKNKSVGAYTKALNSGWLNEYTWFSNGRVIWTKERCYEEAKKYKTIKDFKHGCISAYKKATLNNWINTCTWLQNITIAPKWNKESCSVEAHKYTTITEFRKASSGAYKKAKKEGWLKEYYWLAPTQKTWTYELCYSEAKKFSTYSEFLNSKESRGAYKTAKENGWLVEYNWLFEKKKLFGYWTEVRCYSEAKKYEYLIDFEKNSRSALAIARRNGWIVQYDWLIKNKKKWTYKECYALAQRHKYLVDFKNACPSAYAFALQNEWIADYHWFTTKERYRFWTKERCYEEAKKYNSKKEFAESSSAYNIAVKNGWIQEYKWLIDKRIELIRDKIDYVYMYYFKQTNAIYVGRTINPKERDYQHMFEIERDSVAKYAQQQGCAVPPMQILEKSLTLEDGLRQEDYWRLYYQDRGYNIINKAKTGVGSGSLGAIGFGKWTKKACFEEAKKYTTKTEFKEGSGGAYQAAMKHQWLKEYVWLDDSYHIYTEEECLQIAKQCTFKKELINNYPAIYGAAKRRGWLKQYTWLQNATSHPNIKWNKETCLEAAKTCTSKAEFENKYPYAMSLARKNNWLKDYTWFKRPIIAKWTLDSCALEAQKYATRGDFAKNSKSAYLAAWKNGWLDNFFPK